MANYIDIESAIAAGIENMTVRRNNSKQDDGTDTYASQIDWFFFNSIKVINIYASGNSWIGLGSNSEQLKINRRDCAMWYFYDEIGEINGHSFYKLKWIGGSHYSSMSGGNFQAYDIFLIDTGQIVLNWYQVPTTNFNGTKSLNCGTETISFDATAGVPCQYTFTPSDAESGKGWTLEAGLPSLTNYKPSGTAIVSIPLLNMNIEKSQISWRETLPEGTSIGVSTALNESEFLEVVNNGSVRGIGQNVSENDVLKIKIDMTSSNPKVSPKLSELKVSIGTAEDRKKVVLFLESGNVNSFQNADGDITVRFDASKASLLGYGGPVISFEEEFTPDGLELKPNPNDIEHIAVNLEATGNLIHIFHNYSKETEHIELAISASGTLTRVEDI